MKTVLWSIVCVGLGIYLGSLHWEKGSVVEKVVDRISSIGSPDKVAAMASSLTQAPRPAPPPTEKHAQDDRAAIDRLTGAKAPRPAAK